MELHESWCPGCKMRRTHRALEKGYECRGCGARRKSLAGQPAPAPTTPKAAARRPRPPKRKKAGKKLSRAQRAAYGQAVGEAKALDRAFARAAGRAE